MILLRKDKSRRGPDAEAFEALESSPGGDKVVSAGTLYINGLEPADAYQYRLTDKRLTWNRGRDPGIAGFALRDVDAFGSWENHLGHLVVGVDVGGTLWDLVLIPITGHKGEIAARQQHLVVRYLLHALRDAGAEQLSEKH